MHAERDETLDLVAISKREVIAASKKWASAWSAGEVLAANDKLLAAVTLLESREANKEQS